MPYSNSMNNNDGTMNTQAGLDQAFDTIVEMMKTLENLKTQATDAGFAVGTGLSADLHQAYIKLEKAGDAILDRKRCEAKSGRELMHEALAVAYEEDPEGTMAEWNAYTQ